MCTRGDTFDEPLVERRHHVPGALVRDATGRLQRGLEIMALLDELHAERPHRAFLPVLLPNGTTIAAGMPCRPAANPIDCP